MKIFKQKNFKALIYSIFLAMPLLSFLPSTIYFAFNHNANTYINPTIETTYEYETNEVNSDNDIVIGNIYKINGTLSSNFGFQDLNCSMIIANVYDNSHNFELINCQLDEMDMDTPTYYGTNYLSFNEDTITFNVFDLLYSTWRINQISFNNLYIIFDNFDTSSQDNEEFLIPLISSSDYLGQATYAINNNEMNPLNVIENNIEKFINDNNFGKLDFFTWFTSLFLNNNQINNTYVHFVNWYMNYILYVSLAYLLFAVLMWFVNFFRSLVEKNMDLDL